MPDNRDNWMVFINKRAALREGPRLVDVLKERPGCKEDRERQEFYRADNRLSIVRAAQRIQFQMADAERFIKEQRERDQAAFLEAVQARRREVE